MWLADLEDICKLAVWLRNRIASTTWTKRILEQKTLRDKKIIFHLSGAKTKALRSEKLNHKTWSCLGKLFHKVLNFLNATNANF